MTGRGLPPLRGPHRTLFIVLFGALGTVNLVDFVREAWKTGAFAPIAGDWMSLVLGIAELAFAGWLAHQWLRERRGR